MAQFFSPLGVSLREMFGVSKYDILPIASEHSEKNFLCLIGLFHLFKSVFLSLSLCLSHVHTRDGVCACTYKHTHTHTHRIPV